jgi:transcription-repair coupling factor (superfamily II helicase)
MFINDADRFGLAELHQLRGRIGRYKHRAYCYLLLPVNRPLTPIATRRLQAIQRYVELGAGFQIAMRDLEIRGAGNILGRQQSGHIAVVGYEMYCQLLTAAVRRAKGLPDEEARPVDLDLDLPALVPQEYIASENQRLAIYRQLGRANSTEVLEEIRRDLADIYGPVPRDVDLLVDLAAIRVLGQAWGISSIRFSPPDIIFTFDDLEVLGTLFGSTVPGRLRVIDYRTVYLRLENGELTPESVLPILKKILAGDPKKG